MDIDVSKIVVMLDYFTRLINDLLNQVLRMFGMAELTSNDYTLPGTNDILHTNPNDVINR